MKLKELSPNPLAQKILDKLEDPANGFLDARRTGATIDIALETKQEKEAVKEGKLGDIVRSMEKRGLIKKDRVLLPQQVSIYSSAINHFIKIADSTLKSRANIKNVDIVLKTCDQLTKDLKTLDKKLQPNQSTVATDLKTIDDYRKKLVAAKNTAASKNFRPTEVLHNAHESTVITAASPDLLKIEIKKAFSQGWVDPGNQGALSQSTNDTTPDFIQDKARINTIELKSGSGLFKREATVKSAQYMDGTTFVQEVHFDQKEVKGLKAETNLDWAIREFNTFIHANPHQDQAMEIKGKFPKEFVRFLMARCALNNPPIPYINYVNKDKPTDSDFEKVVAAIRSNRHTTHRREIAKLDFTLKTMTAPVKTK